MKTLIKLEVQRDAELTEMNRIAEEMKHYEDVPNWLRQMKIDANNNYYSTLSQIEKEQLRGY